MLRERVLGLAGTVVERADRRTPRTRERDRWTAVFGQIAVFSFAATLLTGVFLAVWYTPSMSQVTYEGVYAPLQGVTMSEAYASTLDLSFEVRGGLLMRQVHQWGSLVFVAAMALYLMRIFLTGAFRRSRLSNWLLVIAVLIAGMADAYLGHLLPDDLLSGTSLRVIEGIVLAIPVIGTYVASLLFGGEFPGDDIITSVYVGHILLTIAIIALAVLHVRRNRGALRISDGARTAGFGIAVMGVITIMAATIQVNPVWLWGPSDPALASAGSQPPWYMGFLDGAVRLMPGWDINVLGYELVLSVLVPAMVVPGILLLILGAYPWLERWVIGTDDDAERLDRARDMPVRTALGAAFVTVYLVLWIAAGNDVIASVMHVSVNSVTRFLQVGLFVLPVLAFWVTKRVGLGLQLREREALLHGRETGMIVADADGGFSERHVRLPESVAQRLTERPRPTPVRPEPAADANGVLNPTYRADRHRAALSRFYFADIVPTTDDDSRPKLGV